MNGRGLAWAAIGFLTSGLLHASAFWALAAMVAPERFPEQAAPEARLDIVAQNVPRGKAASVAPDTEALSQGEAPAVPAQQGSIARAQALAVAPEPQQVAASLTSGEVLSPAQSIPDIAALAEVPQTVQASSAVALADEIRLAVPAGLDLKSAPASAPRITPASPLVQTAARAQRQALDVTTVQPETVAAPASELPQTRQKAALAWAGDSQDTSPLAAASLAAIAAFTRPEDTESGAGEVRDGIAGILASVPCARLQTVFIPETGTLEIRGHIPEDAMRGPVLSALAAQVGGSIPLSDQLLILPRPQCAALAGIAGIGLPQSTEQLTNPRVIGAAGFARNYTYANGQRLELELQAPDYPSYVYVDYFTADGMVIHLQPNTVVGLQIATPKSALSVGKPLEGQPFLDLTIGPPFGQEIAAAFAASVPLYDMVRPLQEPASAYLDFLRAHVTQARKEHQGFKGEWVYFFISTVPE